MRSILLACAAVLLALSTSARAADVPRSVAELWAGYDPRHDPLDAQTLKAWEQDGVVCRIVRYKVGVFKDASSWVAAFYAFPKGATALPAILDIHGGGQSASLDTVVTYAKRGYATLSINWGGNKMSLGKDVWDGPQTDWGTLDATHPPQRNKVNHFVGSLAPDAYTLDAVESPRNSNWFVVLIAARRAVTFLERQPEVDPARIGARGHSMGGKLTTDLAGIDDRIQAAVPSCGGAGDPPASQANPLELACISDNAYIPLIRCPVLWLSPTNDFHAQIDNMALNWRDVPDDRLRFSISPHLNHRHTDEHALSEYLWFEEHLKGAAFKMPQTPNLELDLKTADRIPALTVTPDASHPVRRVDVYYSIDPHALTRFWRDAKAVKVGDQWKAQCPVMNVNQPIFAYADVAYETPPQYRRAPQRAGQSDSDTFALSSRVRSATPAQLRAAEVKATDQPDHLIDDGTRGWHDWYLLNWAHPPLWTATTRKLKDPKYRGPDGATLRFDIACEADNQLVLTFNTNAWGAIVPGQPPVDYAVVKPLRGSPDWQTVSVRLDELTATDPKVIRPLTNWRSVTEFTLSPSGTIVIDGQKTRADGKPWRGSREIRNLRWEGGQHPPQPTTDAALRPDDFQHHFDRAIDRSLQQEKLDRRK